MSSKIEVPEEMRLKYIERRRNDVTECLHALENGDFAPLARVGHQLKGNASTFGYDELVDIAASMEEAALKEDRESSKAWLQQFTAYVEKM